MRVFIFFVVVVFGIPAALFGALSAALEDAPLVAGSWQPTPADIARARAVLTQHDPRLFVDDAPRRVVVSERDLNLAANYALSRVSQAAVQADMRAGELALNASVRLPANPLGRFVNVKVMLRSQSADKTSASAGPLYPFTVTRLEFGNLAIPTQVAEPILNVLLNRAFSAAMQGNAGEVEVGRWISSATFRPASLEVTYRLPHDAIAQLKSALVSPEVLARVEYYQRALVKQVQGRAGGSLARGLLKPLFALAQANTDAGADPVVDNHALLVVLGAYASGRGLSVIAPESVDWPKPRAGTFSLHQRPDLAQHFLSSGALAVMGGGALSDAVGLLKEVDDSQGGSGFSFTDLAADRAGTRFGQVAVSSQAARLQRAVSSLVSESELMPATGDLPEGMTAKAFARRFERVGSPAYQRVIDTIERRLNQIALYQ
jgi:hypothetical protein